MGYIAKEAFLAIDETGQAGGHLIDRCGKQAKLVAAGCADGDIEPALGNAGGGGHHFAKGASNAVDQRQPEEQREEDDGSGGGDPWGVIEHQTAEADGIGNGDQRERRMRMVKGFAPRGLEGNQEPIAAGLVRVEHPALAGTVEGGRGRRRRRGIIGRRETWRGQWAGRLGWARGVVETGVDLLGQFD